MAPRDLQYLTDENIEEIGAPLPAYCEYPSETLGTTPAGGAMTHVEKMRFQAALQTLRGTGPLSTETEPAVDARGVCAEEEGQAAAGTE